MAKWDYFLEDAALDPTCGFINVPGPHKNIRILRRHRAPGSYALWVGESCPKTDLENTGLPGIPVKAGCASEGRRGLSNPS